MRYVLTEQNNEGRPEGAAKAHDTTPAAQPRLKRHLINPPQHAPALLTKEAFAYEVSLCKRSVDALLKKGLPHVKLSARCLRIPREAGLAWIAARTIGTE